MNFMRRLFSKSKKSSEKVRVEKNTFGQVSPNLGFSDAPEEWQTYRENLYRKWFGNSEGILVWHEILPVIPHVDIHVFPPSKELGRDYFTLITSGMSDEKMLLPKDIDEQYARAEIIFYIENDESNLNQTEKPWYVQSMSFLAHFPFDYKTWLAVSHTIPNGDPPSPVINSSTLTTAFFVPAIFEAKEFIQEFKLGTEKVNILWLTYLNNKETEFVLKYGYDKFMEKLNPNNFPQVFSPYRQSVI